MPSKPKVRFYTLRSSFGVGSGVILLCLSIVFRLIGCWGMWDDRYFFVTQIALPVLSALLFILLLLLFGRIALWTTMLPMLGGVAFFVLRAFTFDNTVHTVLCVLLYVLIAVLYIATVCNLIRTKWLLPPLFLLPFLYHVGVEDLAALRNTAQPVSFAAGMQEMSVLCIMLAMFFISMAIRKRYKDAPESAAQPEPAPVQPEPAPVQPAPAPVQPAPAPVQPAPAPLMPEPEPETTLAQPPVAEEALAEPAEAAEIVEAAAVAAAPASGGLLGKLFRRGEKAAKTEEAPEAEVVEAEVVETEAVEAEALPEEAPAEDGEAHTEESEVDTRA